MARMRHPQHILHPAKGSFIAMSLLLALCLELLPLGPLPWRPDVLLVVLTFWVLYQPSRVGIVIAFILGLAMDVHSASLLGQHALAYIVVVSWVQASRNRILWYQTGIQQGVLLLVPFAIAAALQAITGWIASRELPHLSIVVAVLLEAALWPFIRRLLLAPQMGVAIDNERAGNDRF